jgi:anti-sigma-K factor RskA
MQHTALNPTHQRAIERLYKADRKLCALVDSNQRKMDDLDADSDRYHDVAERSAQREAEMHYDFVERYIEEAELPKREIEAFTKSYVAFHGYTPYLV